MANVNIADLTNITSLLGAYEIEIDTGSASNAITLTALQTHLESALSIEGSAIASTGETGGTKFLREDGDGTCSWQEVSASGGVSDGDKGDITVSSSGSVWTIDAGVITDAKLSTGIDAAKLANGTVSNTEFQYLNGVTSNLQTQLDGKQASGSYAAASHTHAASDVTSGTFADARIAQSSVTQHQGALNITESQISDLGSYATNLSGLSDVDATVSSPSDGDILVFRSAGSDWVLEAKPAAGSNPAIADITDWPAGVDATEVGYLNGVTSAIQTQLDGKQASGSYETADPDILKADVGDTLTAGYTTDANARGTVSSGTVTPAPGTGEENFQTLTNGGAFTLAPPASNCTVVIQITNNASAGAITTSGFTKVDGSFTTTNGDDFIAQIIKIGSFSYLNIVALQ